jgi:sortase A
MTRRAAIALTWIERIFLVIGLALGLWAAVTLLEGRYYSRMPVPTAPADRRLPGEEPDAADGTSGTRTVERGSWLARLEAPAAGLSATVLEGSDDRTLRRAAGHIEYTPLPGEPGNVGIAGHRDTTFYPLRKLSAGDLLRLTTADRVLEYRVSHTRIVDPDAVDVLDPTPGPTLTLVTCYPFNFVGNAPKRFIVQAGLVSEKPR